MKDNLSIIISMIIFVILIVIFPLYNYFERQDDMSYNLVNKATTNFVDEVTEAGYLDQDMYNRFVDEISSTGNVYDIQLEAHKKIRTSNDGGNTYDEQYLIDYNNQIFSGDGGDISSNLNERTIKDNAYYLNEGDQFYVKLKNSNTTMAGAIFNTIVPASSKDRIVVNYGGIIKNEAWAKVDSTYRDLLNVNEDSPIIKLDNQVSLGYNASDNLNGKKIYLAANVSGSVDTLKFSAEGPLNFIKNWHANVTNYLWKIDDSETWEERGVDESFDISSLAEGEHTIYVKACDRNNDIFSDEANVTIVVKKRVTMILAGLGWKSNISWDVDLHFYITKTDGKQEKIDYASAITDYGTLSGDDQSGTKNLTDNFYTINDTIKEIETIKKVNEYICISENNNSINNFLRLENIGANKIDIYVNSYTSGTTLSGVLNMDKYNNFVNTDIIILYADNSYDRTIQKDFSKFGKTVRIATLQKASNNAWVLDNKNIVAADLPK